MIELIHFEAQKIVGLRIASKVEKADIEHVTAVIEARLKTHDKLRIYVEIENLAAFSLSALAKDIAFGLGHLRDFDKEAIVYAKEWAGKLTSVVDKLFPSIQVRHFTFDQMEAAKEWIQQ